MANPKNNKLLGKIIEEHKEALDGLAKHDKKNKPNYILYHKARIKLPGNPRRGICQATGKIVSKGEISKTNIHHTKYAYTTKEVRKNPILALENTLELSYWPHKIADALRLLYESDSSEVINVLSLHSQEFIDKINGDVVKANVVKNTAIYINV